MARAYLSRRVNFAAAHRYDHPEWNDFHSHDYSCELTIAGEIDPVTGFIFDLVAIDRILAEEVTDRFDGKNINSDVPEFAHGGLQPSGENLAKFVFERVRMQLPDWIHIESVTIAEDETLSSTYKGEN